MALPEEARMNWEDTVIEGEHLADLVAMDNAAGPLDAMGRWGEEKREAAMLKAWGIENGR